jgi:hypothetical protein
MISLEPITPRNAMVFKEIRLRALQDAPSAFSSNYAKEAQLSDGDWVQRAAQWPGPSRLLILRSIKPSHAASRARFWITPERLSRATEARNKSRKDAKTANGIRLSSRPLRLCPE